MQAVLHILDNEEKTRVSILEREERVANVRKHIDFFAGAYHSVVDGVGMWKLVKTTESLRLDRRFKAPQGVKRGVKRGATEVRSAAARGGRGSGSSTYGGGDGRKKKRGGAWYKARREERRRLAEQAVGDGVTPRPFWAARPLHDAAHGSGSGSSVRLWHARRAAGRAVSSVVEALVHATDLVHMRVARRLHAPDVLPLSAPSPSAAKRRSPSSAAPALPTGGGQDALLAKAKPSPTMDAPPSRVLSQRELKDALLNQEEFSYRERMSHVTAMRRDASARRNRRFARRVDDVAPSAAAVAPVDAPYLDLKVERSARAMDAVGAAAAAAGRASAPAAPLPMLRSAGEVALLSRGAQEQIDAAQQRTRFVSVVTGRPEDLVGCYVEVEWSQRKQYRGSIVGFSPQSRQHTLRYDDGETHSHNFLEAPFPGRDNRLLRARGGNVPGGRTAGAATARPSAADFPDHADAAGKVRGAACTAATATATAAATATRGITAKMVASAKIRGRWHDPICGARSSEQSARYSRRRASTYFLTSATRACASPHARSASSAATASGGATSPPQSR